MDQSSSVSAFAPILTASRKLDVLGRLHRTGHGSLLLHDDCMKVLARLPDNCIDSVVTDPPYHLASVVRRFGSATAKNAIDYTGIRPGATGAYARASRGFMGKTWDGGDIAFRPETWAEVLRVLKPGGLMLAFAAPRNQHRMICAIEDSGFEVRDMLMWLYGQGFAKNKHVLKPAFEPICLARKRSKLTVARNIAAYGVGSINVDACRVPSEGGAHREGEASQERRYTERGSTDFAALPGPRGGDPAGRWPANVLHDGSEEVVRLFPSTKSGKPGRRRKAHETNAMAGTLGMLDRDEVGYGDEGSAARFFYTAKANAKDRAGSKHPTVKPLALMRYLTRLVTPPGGLVLDPFAGSGTTGQAAVEEGFNVAMIEREEDHIADIIRRMNDTVDSSHRRRSIL